jgi:hypothetical protein
MGFRRTPLYLRAAFTNDQSVPLPLSLVFLGLGISVLAVLVGGHLGWSSFTSNAAANLALLGPGLLVTNVLVKVYRQDRMSRRARPAVTRILSEVARYTDLPEVTAGTFGHKSESLTMRPRAAEARSLRQTIEQQVAGLSELRDSVEPDDETVMLTPNMLVFPNLILVDRLVDYLDSVVDMPETSLASKEAVDRYNRQYFTLHTKSSIGGGALTTQDSVDDLYKATLPNAILGAHHNPKHFIERMQLLTSVISIGSACVQIIANLEKELPVLV